MRMSANLSHRLASAIFLRIAARERVHVLILFVVLVLIGTSLRAQTSAGYRDFYFGVTASAEPTSEKPQSKLWWNDGLWWGSLWNPNTNRYEIHRFDLTTQSWSTTNTPLDTRSSSRGEVLWDGQHLYLASHIYSVNPGATTTNNSARLYRLSYSTAAKTYALDAGFPITINSSKSEALVLDKDSTGKLWITWAEGGKVMMNRSTSNDLNWGAPFALPTQGNDADVDDIATLVAFAGKLGVLWSNQKDSTLYFATREDAAADSVWQAREVAMSGLNVGKIIDDQLHLRAACDNSGNLYAAVKTNLTGVNAAGIYVLKRSVAGEWSKHTFATANFEHSKPIVLLNHDNQRLYVITRSTETGASAIYLKSASLSDLQFPPGLGATFIANALDLEIQNPTSTKQCVNNNTGLLVLAADKINRYYSHNYIDFAADKPVINSFSPLAAPVNSEITILGQNFNSVTAVTFNGIATSFTIEANTQLRANVPSGAGQGKIRITNAIDVAASASDFTLTAPPTISSFAPTNGPSGTEVTITGNHLATLTSITLGGIPATSFTIDSNTQARALVPVSAITGKIAVANPDGDATSANDFIVTKKPEINSFVPERAQKGAEVLIKGKNFIAITQVTFNGMVAQFTLEADSALRAIVPTSATTGTINVSNSAGTGVSAKSFVRQYALTTNVLGMGSIVLDPLGNVYDQGTNVNVSAIPATGWKFQDWDGALDGPIATQTLLLNGDKSVTANFTALAQYTLTIDTLGAGTVSINPLRSAYYHGELVMLTPQPDSGYAFVGWQGALQGYASPAALTMMANKQVKALFTKIPTKRFASGIWSDAAELSALPTTGMSWTEMKAEADLPTIAPNLANKDDSLNVRVLAKALVYARTGLAQYRDEVRQACLAAIGTEQSGETLALGRELMAYVIAADLVGLSPEEDAKFRGWLQNVVRDTLWDNRSLQTAHEERPNNWGTHCGASRAAVAAYLNDTNELARSALVFRGWLGNRELYADFSYGEAWWQADSMKPVGINPLGAIMNGHSVDGVLPDDQRRSGPFAWPPPHENYVYEALQGALAQAVILYRAGYDVWNWENAALRRAFDWLYQQANFPAEPNDRGLLYLINYFYKTSFATPHPTRPGKNVGWMDWTHGKYYKLNVNVVGSGTVTLSPPGGVYEPGTKVKLTAVPATNWEFVSWSGANNGVANPITVTMSSNKNVTATFNEITAGMVKHEETQSGGASNLTTVATTISLTAAEQNLYLAAIATRPRKLVNAVSGLGLSWTLVKRQCAGRNATGVEVWMAQGTPNANGMVTATLAAAPTSAVITVSRYSGVAFPNPLGKKISSNTNGANGLCSSGVDTNFYAMNLNTSAANVMLFSAATMRNRTHTPGPGYLERIEAKQGLSNSMASLAVQDRRIPSITNALVKGTLSGNTDWAVVAMEIMPQAVSTRRDTHAAKISAAAELPLEFALQQNYPNPFNASTMIEYALPEAVHVQLRIFNQQGQLVRTLAEELQNAGIKRVAWEGRDDAERAAGTGVYFLEMKAGEQRFYRKLMLVK